MTAMIGHRANEDSDRQDGAGRHGVRFSGIAGAPQEFQQANYWKEESCCMTKSLATAPCVRSRVRRSSPGKPQKFQQANYWKEKSLRKTNPLVTARGVQPRNRAKGRPNGWTPERRARQAASIRCWQPWRCSTGPKTDAGKARVAKNALRHGRRSRAWILLAKRVRRAIRLCARTVLLVRAHLREQRQLVLLQKSGWPDLGIGLGSEPNAFGLLSAERAITRSEAPRSATRHPPASARLRFGDGSAATMPRGY